MEKSKQEYFLAFKGASCEKKPSVDFPPQTKRRHQITGVNVDCRYR